MVSTLQKLIRKRLSCSIVVVIFLLGILPIQSWKYTDTYYPACLENGHFPDAPVHTNDSDPSFSATVLTLPYSEESGRYTEFVGLWQEVWPSLNIYPILGVTGTIRGLGHTVSTIQMLESAHRMGSDIALILEDDAVPFEATTLEEDIKAVLPYWEPRSPILFLGAHHIKQAEQPDLQTGLTKIKNSLGSYAYMVRREHLLCLANHIRLYLSKPSQMYSTDHFWWKDVFPHYSSLPVLATPLLVDHKSGGWSSTWGKIRKPSLWEGKRNWWTVKNVNGV
eukprot:TRINITY_DN7724_c0_g1_i1.p1 TRINITY_DN7724_c0_g1~~TRINITY_DN7724_c0_g1_i1.p1  ORF type:complete len:279 (+),score=32.98 TRINITY_DN7724_c0_g1_i1:59-895(+)